MFINNIEQIDKEEIDKANVSINILPNEIIYKISVYLDLNDKHKYSICSKYIYNKIRENVYK